MSFLDDLLGRGKKQVLPPARQVRQMPQMNQGQQLQVAPNAHAANLGVGYYPTPQMNSYNPGYTPLQNSGFGPGGYPQIRAFNQPMRNTYDPQFSPTQQMWY